MPSPGDQPDFRNTTVDGHRAFLEADPTSAALAVFDVPGLRVDVDAEGADVVARAAVVDVYRGSDDPRLPARRPGRAAGHRGLDRPAAALEVDH